MQGRALRFDTRTGFRQVSHQTGAQTRIVRPCGKAEKQNKRENTDQHQRVTIKQISPAIAWPEKGQLALARLKPLIGFVDDIKAATTTDQLVFLVTVTQRLQRIADFHLRLLNSKGRNRPRKRRTYERDPALSRSEAHPSCNSKSAFTNNDFYVFLPPFLGVFNESAKWWPAGPASGRRTD